MQPPVRVKIYGLVWVTKRTYLICVAIGAVGLVAALVVWALTTGPATPLENTGQYPLTPIYLWRNWAPWILGGAALVEVAEVLLVLRRFHRAEAEQQPSAAPEKPKGS
jgi:hypothetical protein